MDSGSKTRKANIRIEEAKCMVRKEEFISAKTKIQEAIKLFPSISYSEKYKPIQYSEEIWPHALQIPSSSTETEIKSSYKKLMEDLKNLKRRFPSVRFAVKALRDAMPMWVPDESSSSSGGKRKFVLSDDSDDDASDEDEDLISCRSHEFKRLRKQIFSVLPQNPHYQPLSKYCPSVTQEIKSGFDVLFLKLTKKIQELGDSPEFLTHEEEIREELGNLEEMGYHVKKVKDRFNLSVTLAKEDRAIEKQLDAPISDEMVQLQRIQSRISELEKENESSKAQRVTLKSAIAALKS